MKTEWIFAFNANGHIIPSFIRFVTNKSPDEIKSKFGENSYSDESGRSAVSIWYCDEYTTDSWQDKYGDVGREVANFSATFDSYDLNHPDLEIINTDMIPTVDLDAVMTGKKTRDTSHYEGWSW